MQATRLSSPIRSNKRPASASPLTPKNHNKRSCTQLLSPSKWNDEKAQSPIKPSAPNKHTILSPVEKKHNKNIMIHARTPNGSPVIGKKTSNISSTILADIYKNPHKHLIKAVGIHRESKEVCQWFFKKEKYSMDRLIKPISAYISQSNETNDSIQHLLIFLAKRTHELLEVIHHLHETIGYIHQDIKPANLVLDSKQSLKLIDFDMALTTNASNQVSGGTPAYIAPERVAQLKNNVDLKKSDVWSIGATIFHLVTGTTTLDTIKKLSNYTTTTKTLNDTRKLYNHHNLQTEWISSEKLSIQHDEIKLFITTTLGPLLKIDPTKRASITEAKDIINTYLTNHKSIQIDNDDIINKLETLMENKLTEASLIDIISTQYEPTAPLNEGA